MTTQPLATQPDLTALITRQATVSAALTAITSLQEAAILAQGLIADGDDARAVGLLVYLYDEAGRFSGLRHIHGTADSLQDEAVTDLTLSQVGDKLRAMIAGVGPVEVPDVGTLKDSDANLQSWLVAMGAGSCIAQPVRLEEKSIGALVVTHSDTGHFPDTSVMSVYQAVANQIATVARLHLLADEVEGARQESRTLTNVRGVHNQASRELLSARDGRDVLRILKAHLARDARQIALYTIDWEERSSDLCSFKLDYLITQDGEMREPGTELLNMISNDDRTAFQADWQVRGRDVDFVEDIEAAMKQRSVLKFDYERNIRSAINIPIYDEGSFVHQISIAYETVRIFPEALRRVYEALRDQITVVLQNRRLLRTTEESLRETRSLYDINRELMSAKTSMDVLRVLRIYIANDNATLSLREIEWPLEAEKPSAWTLVSLIDDQGNESVPRSSLLEHIDTADLPAFREDWKKHGQAVDFIEDIDAQIEQRPVLKYHAMQGAKSSVVIPVYDHDTLAQQIRISYKSPRTFSPSTRRLYGAIRDQMTIILQNRRLLRLTEDSLQEARTIYTANRDLLAAASPVEVLNALYKHTAKDADLIYLLTIGWDEDEKQVISARITNTLTPEGAREVNQELLDSATPDEARWLQNLWLEMSEDVTFVEDVPTVLEKRPDLRYARGMGARSVIVMPVFRRNRIIHQIGVIYKETRHFERQTERLYAALNDQIGIIMQNQRLLYNSQRQATQLQVIADFGQATQSTLEIKTTIQIALDSIVEMLAPDYAGVYIFDRARAALEMRARADDGTPVEIAADTPLITALRTTAMQVWQNHRTFYSNDLLRVDTVYHTIRRDISSVIGVPVFSQGTPIGVVEVGAKHRDAYTRSDVAALQQLVGQMSMSIENAETYQRSERSAESKARVNEISSKLQQQMDLERILSVTANELGRALGAKRARIRFGNREDYAANGTSNGAPNGKSNGNGSTHQDPGDRE